MAKIKVIQNTENRDTQIIKSNALIEAKYRLSKGEQRLVLLILGSIEREDPDFQDYFIKVRDFIDMFALEKSKGSYADLKKAIDALEDRKIEIMEGNSWEKFRWFSYARYVDGSGMVQIRFDPAMKPYLQWLSESFTKYWLKNVIQFKNKYSFRLYEFFKKDEFKANWHKQFKIAFELKDLRERLGIQEDEYPVFADFRRRVLDPAKKDISRYSDVNIVQIDFEKEWRAISRLVFHIEYIKGDKKHPELEDRSREAEQVPEIIAKLVEFGISEETARSWKKHYKIAQIERNLGFVKAKIQEWTIKDKCGYLAKAIQGDYGGDWAEEQEKKKEAKRIAQEAARESERKEEEAKKKMDKNRKIFDEKFSKMTETEKLENYRRFGIPEHASDSVKRSLLRAGMAKEGMLNQD